jgi:TonB-linked SusC/RagA family outer membrane protein
MFKKFLALAFIVAVCAPAAHAQTATLTGTVTDARTNAPIAGAQVYFEQLQRGVLSSTDGIYRFPSLEPGTYQVRVIHIGYRRTEQTITISAGANTQDFSLTQDMIDLDAIVVTGQQIARQARELAYSVSTVSAESLTRARETNFVNSLAGKVPGVEISPQSGNLGGSTRITIRGISSLSGDNQPLFIVDGVPISNANIVAGTSQDRLTGAIDVGNRGADINADDIESVTVLKGAAAAALYGQRAKDGVILITTKRGAQIQGQTVTANSSVRVSSPLVLPDYQNVYAQGSAGTYSAQSMSGWGPTIRGQEVENARGETVNLAAFPNNVRDFYEQGVLTINSFAFSSSNDDADFRIGLTRQEESGILPSSRQIRNSINLNTGYQLTPRLTARMSGVYTSTDSRGRAVQGGNDPNVMVTTLSRLPRTVDINDLQNHRNEDGTQRQLTNFFNNPYWVARENVFSTEVGRVFGSNTLAYTPTDWLTLTSRGGIDFYTENRRNINAVGTVDRQDGLFSLDVLQEKQLNFDFLSEARHQLNEDFSLRGILGYNVNTIERRIQRNRAATLTVPGLLNFANAQSNNPANSSLQRRLFGVFGDATLGYRDYLFLNVTGRNDWSSTLPVDNNSYFYPSINTSFVFTDAFEIAPDILSYGKLRANYAQVGSDEAPYQLDFRFFPVSTVFGQYGTTLTFPFGGRTAFNATGTIPPTDLRPQNQISTEIGGEFQFFEGRLGFDLTWYDIRTEDQIISIPIPISTGFAANRTNVGEVSNKGVEAQVNINPVRTSRLNWDLDVNFTRNRNEVVSLADDLEEIVIASGFSSLQVKAEPGTALGLYGPGFLRDEETGLPIIDPNNGLRLQGEIIRLGDIDPDFRLTFNNNITYGNLRLAFLIDWREGGSLFSETVATMRDFGTAAETLVNRDGSFIDEGVIVESDGTTRPNDVPVQNMQAFWQRYNLQGIHEGKIFDASNARLREVRVDYSLPRSWMAATPFAQASIGFEARNLWLFYKKVPHIDPEVGLFGSASNGQGIEWNVLPSTRSFGTNVQVRF